MIPVRRRLGLPILLTALFLFTSTLYWHAVDTHLKSITLVWKEDVEELTFDDEGVRLVVFGDSWVDSTVDAGHEGKGQGWTTTLCGELRCKSLLNFARSSSVSSSFPEQPHGVVVSSDIHRRPVAEQQTSAVEAPLPDFAAQIQSFISQTRTHKTSADTIFVVSFGFWDVYNLASQDFAVASRLVEDLVATLFAQLTVLHIHFQAHLRPINRGQNATDDAPTFRVVIPKVLDPSLAPGWQTQRPIPLSPGNVAEEQRNAVYLTNKWNLGVENGIARWLKPAKPDDESQTGTREAQHTVVKDSFYYDLPAYVLDELVERNMEIQDLTDAYGYGNGDSAFDDVYLSCVSDDPDLIDANYKEVGGKMVCQSPKDFLWWDAWRLGSVASEAIGHSVAQMVKDGDSLRKAWIEAKKEGFV